MKRPWNDDTPLPRREQTVAATVTNLPKTASAPLKDDDFEPEDDGVYYAAKLMRGKAQPSVRFEPADEPRFFRRYAYLSGGDWFEPKMGEGFSLLWPGGWVEIKGSNLLTLWENFTRERVYILRVYDEASKLECRDGDPVVTSIAWKDAKK